MKNTFLVLLFLSLNSIFSQTVEEIITSDFNQIISYTRQKKIDKVLDMTYPRLFEVYPKEMLSSLATDMLEGMGITTIYEDNETNLIVSPVKNVTNTSAQICVGRYNQNMILEFNNENAAKIFSQSPMNGYTVEVIDAKKIRMLGVSFLLAINDKHTNNSWRYMNYSDEPSNPVNDLNILDSEILVETKKLIENF